MEMNRIDENLKMISIGMSIAEVADLVGNFEIKEKRDENSQYDYCEFNHFGVIVFFDLKTKLVDTIRFDSPFGGELFGIRIGMTKKEVKALLGEPTVKDPFPDGRPIWIYRTAKYQGFLRLDFDKQRNGRVATIFR